MQLVNHTFNEKNHHIDTKMNLNKKIVLISDIHFSSKFKKEKVDLIINKIKAIKPNYICIPGDILDCTNVLKDNSLKDFISNFLKEIAQISKTIITIGNHDNYNLLKKGFRCTFSFDKNEKWFKEINNIDNVIFLDNEIYEEDNIRFIGFNPSSEYYENERENEDLFLKELQNKIPQMDNKKYNILLCHTPLYVLTPKTINILNNINLILSGHMHNGVVPPIIDAIFKGNKGIFSPDGTWFFKTKFTRGIYNLENKTLIISGGITKIHDCSPNILVPFNELFPMSIDIINLK
ncbi:MAG: metallophosphoesterase [Bacilli bacterium]